MIRRRRAGRLRIGLQSHVETSLFDRLRHVAVIVSAMVLLGVGYVWLIAQCKGFAAQNVEQEHTLAGLQRQILGQRVVQTRLVGDQDQLLLDLKGRGITMHKSTEGQKRRLGETDLLVWLAPLERSRGSGFDPLQELQWAKARLRGEEAEAVQRR